MSLKGDKYETTEEVKARLENTVVMYDGTPVYITEVMNPQDFEEKNEVARVFFLELPLAVGGKKTRKFLSSKKFDLTPLKMGYFNHEDEAIFVTRAPVRQYKQGLSSGTTILTNCRGGRSDNINFNGMIKSKGFVDMLSGDYPDFKAAGELLGNKETSSIAVSRSFCFKIDHDLEALLLLHKGTKCGLARKGDKAIKIPEKFLFLREEMEEHRIPIM